MKSKYPKYPPLEQKIYEFYLRISEKPIYVAYITEDGKIKINKQNETKD